MSATRERQAPSGGAGGSGPTIHDVAAMTGVSISTVSRALGRPERVNPATRERVLAAAAELGYAPNPQAKSLLSGRTNRIALFVPDITNPFFFGLIRGAQRHAAEAGYTQLLVDTDESPEVEARYLHELAKSVDGFVLAAPRMSDTALADASRLLRLVVINRNAPDVPGVLLDTPTGMSQAVEHLASLGHRRLVYLAGPPTSWSDGRKWRAVQTACRRLVLEVSRLGPFAPTLAAGAAAADVALHSRATGLLAFNDLIAIGVVTRLAERGVDVPGDLSVIGCDDIFGASFCQPPLTTLAAPVQEAGRVAVDMLLDQLAERPTSGRHDVRLATLLTVRRSTGPARATTDIAGDTAGST